MDRYNMKIWGRLITSKQEKKKQDGVWVVTHAHAPTRASALCPKKAQQTGIPRKAPQV